MRIKISRKHSWRNRRFWKGDRIRIRNQSSSRMKVLNNWRRNYVRELLAQTNMTRIWRKNISWSCLDCLGWLRRLRNLRNDRNSILIFFNIKLSPIHFWFLFSFLNLTIFSQPKRRTIITSKIIRRRNIFRIISLSINLKLDPVHTPLDRLVKDKLN